MEDATPTTTSSSTLLAPEEVYAHQGDPTKSASKAEMTSSEKKSVRRQNRRSRSNQQKHVAELIGQRRGADKDQARNELIGTKGVTVLGKPSQKKQGNKKEKAKLAKKAQLAERNQSGQALKL